MCHFLLTGIPIVYILVTVPGLMPWDQIESHFLPWCHIIGAVSPWIGSFVYHLFMNLERGEVVYYKLLQLDMLGIWISQSFGKTFVSCMHHVHSTIMYVLTETHKFLSPPFSAVTNNKICELQNDLNYKEI